MPSGHLPLLIASAVFSFLAEAAIDNLNPRAGQFVNEGQSNAQFSVEGQIRGSNWAAAPREEK
jgi:hypothetical protein